MNFYLATFKICGVTPPPVFQAEFRLSGYFRNGHTFFSFINNGPIPLKQRGALPFHPFTPPLLSFFFRILPIIPVKTRSNMGKKLMEYFRYRRAQVPGAEGRRDGRAGEERKTSL